MRKEDQRIKTDLEILTIAERDISIVRDVLSLSAPVDELHSAQNLLIAYGEFMKKGRVEGVHPRTWEHKPASEVFPCNTTACAGGL